MIYVCMLAYVHILHVHIYVYSCVTVSLSLSLALCVCGSLSLSLSLALSLSLSLSLFLSLSLSLSLSLCSFLSIFCLFLIPRQRYKVALHKPSCLSGSLSAEGASADVCPDGGGSAAVDTRHEDGQGRREDDTPLSTHRRVHREQNQIENL